MSMVYISDLQELVSQWIERMRNTSQPVPYRDALNECVYELNSIIDKALSIEADSQQMLDEQWADAYLSGLESDEFAA